MFLVLLAAFAAVPCMAQDVTIYRCVDGKSHVTLRDSPCKAGEKQEIRTMQRPVDAPKHHQVAEAPAEEHAPEYADTHHHDAIYVTPPRPLYECVTPDGESYTSDTGDGNPRWVPLWTLGYTPGALTMGPRVGVGIAGGNAVSTIGPATTWGSGTYVRDTCYVLPQADVCDRVRDRRDDIRTRFFNAMPSERDVLRVEERSLNARLDADCGGR